jgi:putative permease
MYPVMKMPFYVKLACSLLIIIATGYLIIIGHSIVVPFCFGVLFAILLMPFADVLEKKARFPRSLACITALVLFLVVISAVFYLLGSQMTALSNDWPAFQQQLLFAFHNLQAWISDTFHIKDSEQMKYVSDGLSKSLGVGTTLLGETLLSITSIVVLMVFTFLYTFFLLYYRQHIAIFMVSLFKQEHSEKVVSVLNQVKYIVKRYIVGLFLQMGIIALLSFIAFTIIGVKYSFMLALFTGIFNVLPYVGILAALILTVLITFATASASHVLAVVVAIIVIHLIDSNYIMPKVVGSKVKINSLIAFLGLILGELLLGIPGMFLSIPVMAVGKIIFDHIDDMKPWGFLMAEEDDDTHRLKIRFRRRLAKIKPEKPASPETPVQP